MIYDHNYIESLDRAAEERAEAYRQSQRNRQRMVGVVLLLTLAVTTSLAIAFIRAKWNDAAVGPTERLPEPPEAREKPSQMVPGVPARDGESIRFVW